MPVLRLASKGPRLAQLIAPLVWGTLCLVGWTQISDRRLPEGEAVVVDRPQQLPTEGYRSSDTCPGPPSS